MDTVMMTIPQKSETKRLLKLWIQKNDVKHWIIGKEEGKGGYKHYQVRMDNRESFERLKMWFPTAHIEIASDNYGYERKEGDFISSEDTNDIRRVRFGELRRNQRRIIRRLDKQSDRNILVIVDEHGNSGKSWLTNWAYERNRAFYVPPTIGTVEGIIQFVCSGYAAGQPYIFIDIPRSWKWSEQLYTAIESIKDGLVYDKRYTSRIRNIRGVKICVFTNTKPKLDRLSTDRWDLIDADGLPLS